MKNYAKKITAAVLVLALAFCMAACGAESPEQIMAKSIAKMDSISSISYTMNMDMEMTVSGQTVSAKTTGTSQALSDPMKMKMDMDVEANGQSTNSSVYLAEENGGYAVYIGTNGEWYKQTYDASQLEQIKQYDTKAAMELYLSSMKDFKENGKETINGTEAVRFDGIVSKEAMNDVLSISGATAQLSSLGLDASAAADLFNDLGEMSMSIWVDTKEYMPVKYEMDMTQVMNNLMKKMIEKMGAGEVELSMDKVVIDITVDGVNDIDDIEIPQDVIDNSTETAA